VHIQIFNRSRDCVIQSIRVTHRGDKLNVIVYKLALTSPRLSVIHGGLDILTAVLDPATVAIVDATASLLFFNELAPALL